MRSDELLLHLEIVLDKGLDELVDAGSIDGEAERLGARGAKLYDRTVERLTQDEVERIRL